jgi:hypothetical protein
MGRHDLVFPTFNRAFHGDSVIVICNGQSIEWYVSVLVFNFLLCEFTGV